MARLSFQLYSARKFDLVTILPHLASIGFTEVEGYGGLYDDLATLRNNLDMNGLRMTSGHFDFAMLRDSPETAIHIARTLDMDAVIIPHLKPDQRPKDFDGWQAFGQTLAQLCSSVVDAGLTFGWHNHDFEFLPCTNGRYPIEAIMEASPDIMLELDLAWVHVAGLDPVDWLQTYSRRLVAAHVKDRAPDGNCADEDGWADLGHGVMDWSRIAPAMTAAGVDLMVLEHDNPSDAKRFASRSMAAASAF